jgi:uncharacterized membrane protein YbhN (UPF0104 family)
VRKYVRIAVSVLLLALIAWRANWSEVAEKFAHLRLELWFAAFGLYLLAQVASARRWQIFARELRFEHTLSQYCAISFIGMFFSLVLPTLVGGDVIRVWYLNGQSGRKWPAAASIILERMNGLLILVVTACIGVFISPVRLPGWIIGSVWSVAASACMGLALAFICRRRQVLSLERRRQLGMLLDLLCSRKIFVESSIMSILVQFAAVLILWCLGISLGLDVPVAYYFVLVPMVSLLMMLPISVNGMGVREGGTVLFLLPLGVAESTALTLAFLWFTTGVAVSLMGGVVYLFRAYPKAKISTIAESGA